VSDDRVRETPEERRRRLAAVFGDVLPDTTRDERDDAEPTGTGPGDSASEAWLKAQVPPHHGG
jgi:hypothetical protein